MTLQEQLNTIYSVILKMTGISGEDHFKLRDMANAIAARLGEADKLEARLKAAQESGVPKAVSADDGPGAEE